MAEYFKTDDNGNIEPDTFILCHRDYTAIGSLYPVYNPAYDDIFGAEKKVNFDFYRNDNEELYESLQNLSIIYIPEKETYYEIEVSEKEDSNGIYKNVSGIDNGTIELSQKILRNIEINTPSDIERDDYIPSLVYDITSDKTISNSILPRILKDKAPEYTIKHVDTTVARLQRAFSIDGTSILDWLRGDFANELDCIVEVDSKDRSISVYDLLTTCSDCGHRGSFNKVCPKCNGHNLIDGYGKNTNIVISIENLAEEIQVVADKDGMKNCFYVTGGDDVITNTVAACNPNGTNYFYENSPEMLADMPTELAQKIKSYNQLYAQKTPEYTTVITNIYDLLDDISHIQYGESSLPSASDATCAEELTRIINGGISPVSVESLSYSSLTVINNAVKTYAKIYLDSGFRVDVLSGSEYNEETHIWKGRLRVSKTADDETYADSEILTVTINDDYRQFLEQKAAKVLSQYNLQNTDVEPDWSAFCLSMLSSYESAYQACLDALIQQGCAELTNSCYDVYKKYYDRHLHIAAQIKILEGQIETLQEELDGYYEQQSAIQSLLNFRNYVGENLYKIWSSYRREDEYSNSNFISDGLNNEELIAHVKELIDKSANELYKASLPQYTVTASTKNLLLMKEFSSIRHYCELGNWIYVQTVNDVYKLRIIEIETDTDNPSELKLTFSNVSKIRNGASDVESILNHSKSMATSYDSVKKQASIGKYAGESINSWLTEGLDSSLYNIRNNNNEEITIDQSGLTGKSYDDVTEDYSDEMIKVTHNVLAFTNDKWKTVSTAVGKSTYHRYQDSGYADGFPLFEGYGVNAKFLNAAYISSSDIIGGDIFSYKPNSNSTGYNYSKYEKTGAHIDLVHSEFEFYGSGNGSSMLFTHNEQGKANLQILNGNVIAGHIYSTDYITAPKDNDGLPLSPVMTDMNLNNGSFRFAQGKLLYNADTNPNYMVVTEGGFRVEDGNGNPNGIFDQKGIDLHSGTYTHIGNFAIGTEGLTMDLGYDFVNRTSTEQTDFNIMQFLYSSDTCANQSTIRLRTPKALLTEDTDNRVQTEASFNGLTIQRIKYDHLNKVYVPNSDYPEVDININGINLLNKTLLNSQGLYTPNTTIDDNGIETEKLLVHSSEPDIFKVMNGNGTSIIHASQSSVHTSVDWFWDNASAHVSNLYANGACEVCNNSNSSVGRMYLDESGNSVIGRFDGTSCAMLIIENGCARLVDEMGNLLPFYCKSSVEPSGDNANVYEVDTFSVESSNVSGYFSEGSITIIEEGE